MQLYYSFVVEQKTEKGQLKKILIGSIISSDNHVKVIPVRFYENKRKLSTTQPKTPFEIPKLGLQLAVHKWKREQKRAAVRKEVLPEPEKMLIDEIILECGTQPSDPMELY